MNPDIPPLSTPDLPVALTGASGRVGSRILPILSEIHTIKGLDLQSGCIAGTKIHPVDLLDLEATIEALQGTRAIIHSAIASYSQQVNEGIDHSILKDYNRRMLDVNIKGTYHVFEAARLIGIPRVIYISSLTVVMGDLSRRCDLDEQLPPDPRNVYACTKLFGEQIARLYQRMYGIETFCLRLGQPYPLGLPQEKQWMEDAYMKGTFVSLSDVARAIDCALRANPEQWGIYNIVSRNAEGVISHTAAREIGFEPKDYC